MNRLLFLVLLLLPFSLLAQKKDESFTREWKKADSLLERGLPESASGIAAAIYEKAKQRGEQIQMMKAQIYMMNTDFQRKEDAFQQAIRQAEEQASGSIFPNNAIWQSIAAQLYWAYYQQNRWKMLERTRTNASTEIADFEQWDASRFFQRISVLYRSSVARAEELERIPIDKYDPVLEKGVNSRSLRPTLLDLLAFRALEYFENEEKDVTRPTFAFVLDDPGAFAPAGEFENHRFVSADSSSLQWQALSIYQRLLRLHANDASKDAFIDADLHRLEFVYRASVTASKKQLYRAALARIEQEHANHPLSALAAVRIVQLDWGTEQTRVQSGRSKAKPETDLLAIRKKLESITAKYPESEGGSIAQQLLNQLVAPELTLTTEQVVLPEEASKVLISYRNISGAWLRLVRLDNRDNEWIGRYYGYTDKWKKELVSRKHVRQWQTGLPASDDLRRHSAELKIDALPDGTYALLLSGGDRFAAEDNMLSYAIFQVSSLSLAQNGAKAYVLDRKTGAPVSGATVEFYKQRYNDNERGYDLVRSGSLTSGKDGSFSHRSDGDQAIKIRFQKDTVMILGYYAGNEYKPDNKPQITTFFFTDRSIYRPGQTIIFKGIMVRKEDNGRKNQVIANETAEVALYDVNGQQVSSQKLTTNEFGSFTGSFKAPEGGLTGNMRIGDSYGTADFSVEEYKRPKFSVTLDTLREAYVLDQRITVKGKALAYAGNTIDNAAVRYRVVRQARFPYWWYASRWGFPASAEAEIVNGTAVTGKDGSFSVSFNTVPDLSVDPGSLPVFTYTVSADVTDLNGETRSGNMSVNAGYTAMQMSIAIPEQARPEDLDTLIVRTENLNGQFVSGKVRLRISKLKEPEGVLRKRLWDTPDQFLMDSLSYKAAFPQDPYRDEDDHLNWEAAVSLFDRELTTTKEGKVAVPVNTWNRNGWYLVEITTTDEKGKELREKKYVQVWEPGHEGSTREALVVLPESQTAEPGAVVKVHALSGYDRLHVLREIQDVEGGSVVSSMSLDGAPLVWTKQLTESDRGGIALAFLTVKENRVYTRQAFINVPWSNKDIDVSWETHRDKLEPGAKETWTMVVSGGRKEKLAAEMVATLYDASLEAFRPHQWNVYGLYPAMAVNMNWAGRGFERQDGTQVSYINPRAYKYYEKSYDRLILPAGREVYRYAERFDNMVKFTPAAVGGVSVKAPAVSKSVSVAGARAEGVVMEMSEDTNTQSEEKEAGQQPAKAADMPLRKNLKETAFFFPQLRTDGDGNIRMEFSMPEALTEWKLMGFAHTKDMKTGRVSGSVKTQKDLMVMPNLPRFLRQGDEIVVSAKISNLSEKELSGTATMELRNALTMQPVELPFKLEKKEVSFTAAKGQSASVSWKLHVPESMYVPVMVQVYARSGNFTDGEENVLPVVTNRMLVTETLPLWMNGNGTKTFSFDKLKHSDTSKTLAQHAVTIEYTGNPAWLAVQSLPYLMEYPYECAEQVFNKYYATALAAHIMAKSPKIKAIFDRWKNESLSSSFKSPLETNQELKSALLEETPWVIQANNESEQRKRLGELFDAYKLSKDLDALLRKLKDLQTQEGGFPWFRGMQTDRYITQYIVTGLGRLKKLGIGARNEDLSQLLARAVTWLDDQTHAGYTRLLKSKVKMEDQHIGYMEVQYLYMRSYFNGDLGMSHTEAYKYYTGQSAKYWTKFNPYIKGMIALVLKRQGEEKTAGYIIQSLRETATRKEELGMYWMQPGYSYWWYDAPIEAQSLLIECFAEVAKDDEAVDQMKIWLLKNKQTNSWETTKATADACYALLLTGTDWLRNEPRIELKLGSHTFSSDDQKNEAGSGYFKQRIEGKDVVPAMGDIALTVGNQEGNGAPSWGAVYWQYFEDMDKISGAATPLELRKQLFIERNTASGPELQEINGNQVLSIGDKVKIRVLLNVDRDMEYVHLKDMRASCMEPVDVISGYRFQEGLGYYQGTRDLSTNFFFDRLPKGKYVFEYAVFVNQPGNFSNGIASIQCMYAPEFQSHSEGLRISVPDKH